MPQIKTKEHYELITEFEKEFPHRRLDKEAKDLWPKGRIYQDGQTNELFLAYRKGNALGITIVKTEASDLYFELLGIVKIMHAKALRRKSTGYKFDAENQKLFERVKKAIAEAEAANG